MDLDTFFDGHEDSRAIFDALQRAMDALLTTTMSVRKSQIAFRRGKAFAWAWIPAKYLRGKHAPLVLTLALRHRDPSTRWKEIVEPAPGRFSHHMELYSPEDLDAEVRALLLEAWGEAS